jgi:hypothetical protein
MVTYSTFRRLIAAAISLMSITVFLSEATADTGGMRFKSSLSFDTYPALSQSVRLQETTSSEMRFRDGGGAGLRYLRLTKGLRIRGWEVRDNFYFGHTKVANRWGLGFLIKHRGIVYGINNMGVQILKQF